MALHDTPVLIYDGKCGFCKIWIEYWKTLTADAITYAASQDVGPDYPQIPEAAFSESVQLVTPSGEVLSGAHAVFETLGIESLTAVALKLLLQPSRFRLDHRNGIPAGGSSSKHILLGDCAAVRTQDRTVAIRCGPVHFPKAARGDLPHRIHILRSSGARADRVARCRTGFTLFSAGGGATR